MKQFKDWISNRPFTAFTLAWVFGATSTAAGLRSDWLPYMLVGLCLAIIVMALSMWKFNGTIVLIAALMMGNPLVKAQEEPIEPAGVGIAVGVTVVCVGAYCVYKFAKFCSEKFPPKDKSTNSLYAYNGGDEYGAAFNYGAIGSCLPGDGDWLVPSSSSAGTLYRLDIFLESPYSIRHSMTVEAGDNIAFQTFAQYQSEMASHGLWVSGMADDTQSFSCNRQTIDPTMSPISFNPVTKAARNTLVGEGEMRRITITRSQNLRNWTEFLVTEVGVGAGIQIVDATVAGQMFYRIEVGE